MGASQRSNENINEPMVNKPKFCREKVQEIYYPLDK
jgi:hypothetical protein